MSFVADQVRRIDAALNRVPVAGLQHDIDGEQGAFISKNDGAEQSELDNEESTDGIPPADGVSGRQRLLAMPSPRVLALQATIRGLSPSPTSTLDSRVLLKPMQIRALLGTMSKGNVREAESSSKAAAEDKYERELEWLLAGKATTQVYGLVIEGILSATVHLADDVWYWDEVLSSRYATALYSVQTWPLRLYAWGGMVWNDVNARGGTIFRTQEAQDTVTRSWSELYSLVRRVVYERSVRELHTQVLSPVTRIRKDVREKQASLKKLRLRNANALGILLGEGLANESMPGRGLLGTHHELILDTQHKWKASIARNVALMEAVLAKVNDVDTDVDKFDAAIGELTEDDPLYGCQIYDEGEENGAVSVSAQAVVERLSRVLTMALPQYGDSTHGLQQQYGKPSRVVRYWLPVTIGILSSSTVLRILVNRQVEITQWVEDFGATLVDFWKNWVVEPTRKVIGTIRHDEGSEVSIMSKRSLEGDRESLERMVVEFAVDNPVDATGSNARLTETEIANIRAKVHEGDLTPVLRAYEKDMSSPFMGAIRGNLIRALLIQVQKTKVDVEVAIGGIDALLKSQELVFGFVGLTPGILVTYFAIRWLRDSFSQKRGSRALRSHGTMLRQLRNIDRLLVDSTPTDFGELPYRTQGLLLCEVHVLRQAAAKSMPTEIYREFGDEAEQLCDVRLGVEKQKQVADRIRWAYARWLF